MPCRLLALPLTWLLVMSFVPPAALPPVPIAELVPVGPVVVAPRPNVEAEVPPAAALPAVPPAAEPAAIGGAAWARPNVAPNAAITAADKRVFFRIILTSLLASRVDIDRAVAVAGGDRRGGSPVAGRAGRDGAGAIAAVGRDGHAVGAAGGCRDMTAAGRDGRRQRTRRRPTLTLDD